MIDYSVLMHQKICCDIFVTVFTARRSYASAVLGVIILSVRPPVCHTHVL